MQSRNQERALLDETTRILKKEGAKALKLAQDALSERRVRSKELQEMITFTYSSMQTPADYFRPALVSLCSRAVGGRAEATVTTGASLVLFGRAVGIHDDLIDKAKRKNRRPTAPGKFGEDMALILSDVLLFTGFTLIRKTLTEGISREKVARVLKIINDLWFEQSESEVIEIQSRGNMTVDLEKCQAKIELRASEMEACTRIGGILGNGTRREIEKLGRYGRLMGIAAILRNEIIDMLEADALRSRIRRESLPLSIVYALQKPGFHSRLVPLLSSRLTKQNLLHLSKTVDDAGGFEYAADLVRKMAEEACSCISIFRKSDAYYSLDLLLKTLPFQAEEWRLFLRKKS